MSSLFPGATPPPPWLDSWMIENDFRFHLTPIAIAESHAGIARLRRAKAYSRAERLEEWLRGLVDAFADRVIAFDLEIAERAGLLLDASNAEGISPGFADVATAATASVHDCVVLTRNLKHFQPLGVLCIDPFSERPPP